MKKLLILSVVAVTLASMSGCAWMRGCRWGGRGAACASPACGVNEFEGGYGYEAGCNGPGYSGAEEFDGYSTAPMVDGSYLGPGQSITLPGAPIESLPPSAP